MLLYQMGALCGLAAARGAKMSHVKPHGALNNMAADDAGMAAAIAGAVKQFDPDLILLAPALSEIARAGHAAGLRVAEEVFADRAYTDSGALVSRRQPGAMIEGAEAVREHVLRMLEEGALVSTGGRRLPCTIHSICVHGDEPSAVATAGTVRDALRTAGFELTALPAMAALR